MRIKPSIYYIVLPIMIISAACNSSNTGNKHADSTNANSSNSLLGGTEDTAVKTARPKPISRNEVNILFRAGKLCKKGKFTEAIKIYDSLLNVEHDNSYIYSSRASAYYTIGQLDKSKADCEQALVLDPGNYYARYTRAQIMMQYNNFTQAIADLDVALRVKPDFAVGYNLRGVARCNIGALQSAKTDFDQSIKLNRLDPSAYYNRGLLYGALQQPDSEMRDYEQALKLYGDYTEARNNLGIVKEKHLKDYKGAIQEFSLVIKKEPNNAKAYCNRGICKLLLHDAKGAISDLTAAIKLKPDYREAYLQRSNAYAMAGNKALASQDMATANKMATGR